MNSKPITPMQGWAVVGEGQRGGWFYHFTIARTRREACEKAVAAFFPDKCPTWPKLAAYARLRVVKVSVSEAPPPVLEWRV